MKTLRLITLLLVSIAVTFTGCESDVDNIDSFESKSKLVVLSYISPQDTMLEVRVQKTQPAIGKQLTDEQRKVKDATVTISNGTSVVSLAYNAETNQYEADARAWPIEAGKTYKLKVVAPGATAEASCTVPFTDGIEITEATAPYSIIEDYYGQSVRRYTITFKWRDAPNVKNFYRTLAFKEYSITDFYGKRVYKEGLYASYEDDKEIQDDEETDNGIMTSEPLVFHDYNYENIDKPYYIHCVLVVSDQNYYLYHRSLDEQEESNGNPFAEPTLMYTNMEGGIGVFAGYNQLLSTIEIE
ncbi:DUF4249 domain-containing protein [Pontibacter sp. KCTC 32443]|uniref:DUF4249 domain-containing protein n=1 Tax=Pontibacter TaxID=323449 RepID=UPI00164D104E|nr:MULTISPECIES: DUF4249 domain-containing protein [Pontibacter]MBC5772514.1 DUF4249 domain-containing protein [Pontibacter sp. KCTC 32443]